MPTILVADDNSNIQKMVSLVFKEKGIRVVAVGNGEAACRKVPEVQPDVVLADVFMPVRNGYEVCEFVKQDPQFAETPVILLVGAFDPLDEKEAQRVGANGVLKKPFVPPEPLIAMVSSLLKIEPPAEEPHPAQTAEETWAPQTPEETGPTARQVAIAAAQAQYANAEAGETVTAFTAPVATPSNQAPEPEPEDDAEPASEWARRRATMDYEIDSADSANLVERLAAQNTAAEESDILASSKHLPFGGANLPVTQPEKKIQSGAAEWADLPGSKAPANSITEASIPEITVPEISVPIEAASPATSFEDTMHRADAITAQPPQVEREPEMALAPAPWSAAPVPDEPLAHSRDAIEEAASASWPLPHSENDIERNDVSAGFYASSGKESHQSSDAPASYGDQSAWQGVPEPPVVLPEVISYAAPAPPETAPETAAPAAEAPSEKPSIKPPIDQATIDDVVAKVISKLEPQLHEALANGVLRPLVEELLSQHRDKK